MHLVRKKKKKTTWAGVPGCCFTLLKLWSTLLWNSTLFISSFHKTNFYSFLWVWTKFFPWHIVMIVFEVNFRYSTHCHDCVWSCFSLLLTMFIKLVVCASNFDVISIEAYDLIPDRKIKSNETKKKWNVISLSHMVNDFISRNTPPNKFCIYPFLKC